MSNYEEVELETRERVVAFYQRETVIQHTMDGCELSVCPQHGPFWHTKTTGYNVRCPSGNTIVHGPCHHDSVGGYTEHKECDETCFKFDSMGHDWQRIVLDYIEDVERQLPGYIPNFGVFRSAMGWE